MVCISWQTNLHFASGRANSREKPANSLICTNVIFSLNILEESRRWLFSLSLSWPYFSLYLHKKHMDVFIKASGLSKCCSFHDTIFSFPSNPSFVRCSPQAFALFYTDSDTDAQLRLVNCWYMEAVWLLSSHWWTDFKPFFSLNSLQCGVPQLQHTLTSHFFAVRLLWDKNYILHITHFIHCIHRNYTKDTLRTHFNFFHFSSFSITSAMFLTHNGYY